MKRGGFKLVNVEVAVKKHLKKIYALAIEDLRKWIKSTLIPALIKGGEGIQGIAETPFIQWAKSNEGLSQLGIYPQDIRDMLKALLSTFTVRKVGNSLVIYFGNFAKLKSLTPHPFSGEGKLEVRSWLELVEKPNPNYGFVPRNKVKRRAKEYIRLNSPRGGLMLKKGQMGSTGRWSVPAKYKAWDTIWAAKTMPKVQKIVSKKLQYFLEKRGK